MKTSNIIWFVLIFGISSMVIFTPFKTYMILEPIREAGKQVMASIDDNEETFSILYTHSIHLSDVLETYTVTENLEIQQISLLYEDTSIGMPADATGEEIFERTEDGKYRIKNMTRTFPYIDIRIGQVVANHRLIYKGENFPLTDFFSKGSLIRMQVKKQSLYNTWKGVVIDG